jgi:hypothetical protein
VNATASSAAGASTKNASAIQHTVAPTSLAIITRRRSKRSPTAPAIGPKNPISPQVKSIVAETHTVDCVRW